MKPLNNSAKSGGIALFLFPLLYFSSFALASPLTGLEDGDNPVSTLAFLNQHANLYFLSGLASVLMAMALIVAVFAVADTLLHASTSLLARVTSTLGLFSAAFFFAHGILRMQSPGTLIYMEGLNREWGIAAYLAVQMAGTQGLGSAGIFALGLWAAGLSLAGWRNQRLPRPLALLGILPGLPWIMGLLGKLELLPDSLWLLYIGSILLGIPVWCALIGVFLVRWKPAT